MTNETRPFDPSCKRFPDQIDEYIIYSKIVSMTPDEYVRQEEGTFNTKNGHFLCTDCYIIAGQPSKPFPHRWVCP